LYFAPESRVDVEALVASLAERISMRPAP